jgi:hypothetical protein
LRIQSEFGIGFPPLHFAARAPEQSQEHGQRRTAPSQPIPPPSLIFAVHFTFLARPGTVRRAALQ